MTARFYFSLTLLPLKIPFFLIMGMVVVFESPSECRYGSDPTGIRVGDGDGLVLVDEVPNYALCKYIKRSAE